MNQVYSLNDVDTGGGDDDENDDDDDDDDDNNNNNNALVLAWWARRHTYSFLTELVRKMSVIFGYDRDRSYLFYCMLIIIMIFIIITRILIIF